MVKIKRAFLFCGFIFVCCGAARADRWIAYSTSPSLSCLGYANNGVVTSTGSGLYCVDSGTITPSTALTLSSAAVSYTAISTDALKISFSSAALSYTAISTNALNLTLSSAAVSYTAISTNALNLTLSSASVSYTAISTNALNLTLSSAAVSYLGKSSSTITELTKSSAAVSYVGISSLTLSNGILTTSSASVSYLGISSGPVTGVTYSSAAVSYTAISTNALNLTLSSASVSYLGKSSVTVSNISFALGNSSGPVDITGDGTLYSVCWGSVNYMVGGFTLNTTSDTITVPVTGKYFLTAGVTFEHILNTHDAFDIKINSSQRQLDSLNGGLLARTDMTLGPVSGVFPLVAGDIIRINVSATSGTHTIDIIGDVRYNYFFGYYLGP